MKRILVLVLAIVILAIGCSKDYEPTGPADIETLTETINHTVSDTVEGEEAISLLTFEDKKVRLFIKARYPDKMSLESDSAKLFENIYKHTGVDNVELTWEGKFTDTYGNSNYNTIMIVHMTKEVADKIKWKDFNSSNLEQVADRYKKHEQVE